MATRKVVLTTYQTEFADGLVKAGRCQNTSEVLREGERLVEQREAEDKLRLIALREAINIGIADIEAGRFRTFDSDEEIDQYLAKIVILGAGGARGGIA